SSAASRSTATTACPRSPRATAASGSRSGPRRTSTRSSTTARRSTSISLAAVALAAAGWLVYTQVWGAGGEHPVTWRDVTRKMGTVEFTRRALGVYHSRGSFTRLLDATMPGRAPKPPKLNWDRDQIVVISLGPRSSTG